VSLLTDCNNDLTFGSLFLLPEIPFLGIMTTETIFCPFQQARKEQLLKELNDVKQDVSAMKHKLENTKLRPAELDTANRKADRATDKVAVAKESLVNAEHALNSRIQDLEDGIRDGLTPDQLKPKLRLACSARATQDRALDRVNTKERELNRALLTLANAKTAYDPAWQRKENNKRKRLS